jgi:alpha-beta hydrolase superfamily lysophospholipase
LIPGSGPFDKDGSVPAGFTSDGRPAYLMRQIADTLTQAGFIVLRYQKRGVTGSLADFADEVSIGQCVDEKIWKTISRETLLEDASRAVAFMRSDGRVSSVSVLGHSEGAMLAPLLALSDPGIRALILLGTPGQNLQEILRFQDVDRQFHALLDAFDKDHDGLLSKVELPDAAEKRLQLSIFDTDKDFSLSDKELHASLEAQFEATQGEIETGADFEFCLSEPKGWYRSWYKAEPNNELLARLREMPVLLMQGEDDQQTPVSEANGVYEAMKKAGKQSVELRVYPELGHGFSLRRNGQPTLGPMAPEVLSDLANWTRSTLFGH